MLEIVIVVIVVAPSRMIPNLIQLPKWASI
jgi:hypothetical protein